MDTIQKALINAGRRDLAEKYYHKISKNTKLKSLLDEKESILKWMNATQHPSSFRTWTDTVERLSKQWTVKSKKLEELDKEIEKIVKVSKFSKDYYKKINELLGTEYKKTAKSKSGFVTDIESDTVGNNNFRKVLYTGQHAQLVLMSLKPGEDIGSEVHPDIDQFFRIDSGSGEVTINGKTTSIKNGTAFIIPAGAKHNVANTGTKDLKLYSIYSPPHHEDGTIHKTKADALKSKEEFTGKTTE